LVYVIEFDGFRIFHGSDSGVVEDLKNIKIYWLLHIYRRYL